MDMKHESKLSSVLNVGQNIVSYSHIDVVITRMGKAFRKRQHTENLHDIAIYNIL